MISKWGEVKSTEEQNFQSEAAVNSVSKIPHLNYRNTSPISDLGSDLDSDSKDDDTSSGGVNRQSCQKLANMIASKVKGWGLPQKLEEFHPLTEDDAFLLRIRSDHDFNLNFINKLMMRLSKQRPNNDFFNKQAVLSYMTSALIHEKRLPSLVNNESFNFMEYEKTKLLRQVQELYGNKIQQLEIISKKTTTTADKSQSNYLGLSQLNPQSIWYKVRKYLLELHGEFIDKSWFSQLEAVEEDMTCKKIILKPATTFIGDWIKHNYGRDMLDACKSHNFTFEFIQADKGARAM
ncbi:MAG: hypothetical protein DMENIID0002_07110 [Rickettsia endosymbiont of Sergentomyia squamirostris]|uniref:DnaA N-terminal domain-containing protein n=1 Tax=Candidatus Tisiphia endosymbiont of Sergentomyia squamirostris TaxID=3113639 RepID=A0AAT9G8H0_9RICK